MERRSSALGNIVFAPGDVIRIERWRTDRCNQPYMWNNYRNNARIISTLDIMLIIGVETIEATPCSLPGLVARRATVVDGDGISYVRLEYFEKAL